METQWQKALEIITSPSSEEDKKKRRTIDVSKLDKERADGVSNLLENKIENEIFETPTSSRHHDRRHSDKLQAYIELVSFFYIIYKEKGKDSLKLANGQTCRENLGLVPTIGSQSDGVGVCSILSHTNSSFSFLRARKLSS